DCRTPIAPSRDCPDEMSIEPPSTTLACVSVNWSKRFLDLITTPHSTFGQAWPSTRYSARSIEKTTAWWCWGPMDDAAYRKCCSEIPQNKSSNARHAAC